MSDESGELIELRQASDEAERKAYFQPFQEGNRRMCGGARRRCKRCSRRYADSERLFLSCPDCGQDRRCRGYSQPNGRCKYHGGMNGSGEDANNYRNGRYVSRTLPPCFPAHIQQAYADAQRSADMTSIVEEHGIIIARRNMIASRLAGPEAEKWWRDLDSLRLKVEADRAAAQSGDKTAGARIAQYFDDILELIEKGATESDHWAELLKLNDKSAEFKAKQAGIERDHSAVLSATQAMQFVRFISQGVKEALLYVKGRVALIRTALMDDVEVETIVSEAVKAIEDDGRDAREVVMEALGRFTETIPIDEVQSSFSAANNIVQGRIRQMVE